jgi:molecular chaperone DnaK
MTEPVLDASTTAALKETLKSDDVEAIQSKTQALAQASMKLGEAMYKAQQAGAGGGESAEGAGGAKPDENVVDAEFTEVDEKKKGAA